MSSVKVEGTSRFDGLYDLGDNDRVFTAREWHWIKKIAGYMPGTISEGFGGQDPDLYIALAVIAMVRSGKVKRELALDVADDMLDSPYTASTITLIGDLEEDEDELPPSSGSGSDESSQNASLSNDDTKTQNGNSSGPDSTSGSAASEETLSPTTA